MTRTALVCVAAAFFEITGFFGIWLRLSEDRPAWWAAPGTVSRLIFAWCLMLVDTNLAGRAYRLDSPECLCRQRRAATNAQMASTSPNGQAPCRKP